MPHPHSPGSLFVTRPSLRSLRLIQTKEPPPSPGKETPALLATQRYSTTTHRWNCRSLRSPHQSPRFLTGLQFTYLN